MIVESKLKERIMKNFIPLTISNPILCLEWNTEKNGMITPNSVSSGSIQKNWWTCGKCKYEWVQAINDRA